MLTSDDHPRARSYAALASRETSIKLTHIEHSMMPLFYAPSLFKPAQEVTVAD